jgi:hypothetical protein
MVCAGNRSYGGRSVITQDFFRGLFEAAGATGRTEIVGLARMVDLDGGLAWFDGHSANRIFCQRKFPSLNFSGSIRRIQVELAQMRVNHLQQFVVHRFGVFFFAAAESFRGAMVQMIAHQISGHAAERFLDAGDLRDDVGTIAIVFDHFLQAADLALDAAEAVAIGFL